MRQIICFILALFCTTHNNGHAAPATYINPEYGYQIKIPHPLHYEQTPPPAPQHGVIINLPSSGQIWIDGSYDAALYGTAQAALAQLLQDSHATLVKPTKQRQLAQLAGLEATFRREGKYASRIIAIRKRGEAIPIIYTLGLDTPQKTAPADKRLFLQIARSFSLLPLPK